MFKLTLYFCTICFIINSITGVTEAVIYTYEDIELRRIFPNDFPQDTVRRTGAKDPEHLGRYAELKSYFRNPKSPINSHFEEVICHKANGKKFCKVDPERYSPEEERFFMEAERGNYLDRRRVYCFMLLCFTEDELDRVVASF